MVSIFKNIWGTVATKNYYLATLFLVINKFFENLVNSKLVNNRNGFRSSHSTAHLLTVLSERSLRDFYRSGSTQAVALDTSNDFDRVFHTGLFHELKSFANSSRVLALVWYFVSNGWLEAVLTRITRLMLV